MGKCDIGRALLSPSLPSSNVRTGVFVLHGELLFGYVFGGREVQCGSMVGGMYFSWVARNARLQSASNPARACTQVIEWMHKSDRVDVNDLLINQKQQAAINKEN